MHRLKHARALSFWIQIRARGDPDTARERGRQIRQNVHVQIRADDRVDAAGVRHHAHRHGVHEHLLPLDFLKLWLGSHERGDFVPEHHPVAHAVALGHDDEVFARPGERGAEREAHDALDADAREDGHFGRGFPGLAAVAAAALARVLALGVLAHEQPVDRNGLAGLGVGPQVRRRPGKGPHGADVGVELQGSAQREEEAPERDVVRDVWVSDSAEEDRVVLLEGAERVGRHVGAVGLIVGAAPGQVREGEGEGVEGCREFLEDPQRSGDHFDPDAVAGHAGNGIVRLARRGDEGHR